jgi:hypothetical protein
MLDADYKKEIHIKERDALSFKVLAILTALNELREEREQVKEQFASLLGVLRVTWLL